MLIATKKRFVCHKNLRNLLITSSVLLYLHSYCIYSLGLIDLGIPVIGYETQSLYNSNNSDRLVGPLYMRDYSPLEDRGSNINQHTTIQSKKSTEQTSFSSKNNNSLADELLNKDVTSYISQICNTSSNRKRQKLFIGYISKIQDFININNEKKVSTDICHVYENLLKNICTMLNTFSSNYYRYCSMSKYRSYETIVNILKNLININKNIRDLDGGLRSIQFIVSVLKTFDKGWLSNWFRKRAMKNFFGFCENLYNKYTKEVITDHLVLYIEPFTSIWSGLYPIKFYTNLLLKQYRQITQRNGLKYEIDVGKIESAFEEKLSKQTNTKKLEKLRKKSIKIIDKYNRAIRSIQAIR